MNIYLKLILSAVVSCFRWNFSLIDDIEIVMLQISEWLCRENVVLYVKSDIIQLVSANADYLKMANIGLIIRLTD